MPGVDQIFGAVEDLERPVDEIVSGKCRPDFRRDECDSERQRYHRGDLALSDPATECGHSRSCALYATNYRRGVEQPGRYRDPCR